MKTRWQAQLALVGQGIVMLCLCTLSLAFFYTIQPHNMSQQIQQPPSSSTGHPVSSQNCQTASSPPSAAPTAVSAGNKQVGAAPTTKPGPRWMEEYRKIYDEQMLRLMRGEKPRLSIFQHTDGSGWGNRLRAAHFMFMIGLLTRRLFLIEHQDYSVHFDSPAGYRMKVAELAEFMPASGTVTETWQNWDMACDKIKQHPKDVPLDQLYAEDIIRYGDGTSPDGCIFRDERFHPWLMEMFGTTSRYEVAVLTSEYILSNPNLKYWHRIEEFKREMHFDEYKYHIIIQFRAFVDARGSYDEQMLIFDSFCQDSENVIEKFLNEKAKDWKEKGAWLWFTSDDGTLADRFWNNVKKIDKNRVHFQKSPYNPEHSSYIASGDIKQPIVEWYLLGEADILISTGTTFGQFGAARSNWKPDYWAWQKDHLYKQPRVAEYLWPSCLGLDICF